MEVLHKNIYSKTVCECVFEHRIIGYDVYAATTAYMLIILSQILNFSLSLLEICGMCLQTQYAEALGES